MVRVDFVYPFHASSSCSPKLGHFTIWEEAGTPFLQSPYLRVELKSKNYVRLLCLLDCLRYQPIVFPGRLLCLTSSQQSSRRSGSRHHDEQFTRQASDGECDRGAYILSILLIAVEGLNLSLVAVGKNVGAKIEIWYWSDRAVWGFGEVMRAKSAAGVQVGTTWMRRIAGVIPWSCQA